MKRQLQHFAARRQRGVAAVEAALTLPILILLLAPMLFLGRVFYHYEVAQRAAHDAAVYLSTVPLVEMRTPGQAQNEAALAAAIVNEEIAGLNPGTYAPVVGVTCDGGPCPGFNAPATIRVLISIEMFDTTFGSTADFLVGDGLVLTADASMRYVGK